MEVDAFASIKIENDFPVIHITQEMLIEHNYREPGLAYTTVKMRSNFPVRITAPNQVTLYNINRMPQYQMDAEVYLLSRFADPTVVSGWDASSAYLCLPAGDYGTEYGRPIEVRVELIKDWNLTEDHAGTYTGTVQLQLSPL